jgi:serine/threonine-protein kinase
MGTVYGGHDVTLGRRVAVKVLRSGLKNREQAYHRFLREARMSAAVAHANVCAVHDLGALPDGTPFLVMEHLVGEELADRIAREGALPFDDAVEILSQMLAGLGAAHAKGIVHRDMKPENVFLAGRTDASARDVVVKLLDFGVAKVLAAPEEEDEERLDLTRTGMVMGTPAYMSPEQARGDRTFDARVDLYACGVIFYEALTGRRPFVAQNHNALMLKILSDTPRPARELRPALSAGFDEVIEKAMQRTTDLRYATARDFQQAVEALRDRHAPARSRS